MLYVVLYGVVLLPVLPLSTPSASIGHNGGTDFMSFGIDRQVYPVLPVCVCLHCSALKEPLLWLLVSCLNPVILPCLDSMDS